VCLTLLVKVSNSNYFSFLFSRMKLEKELKIMETKLEMGNSVSNLGVGYRPDGSFCVVPPGSSYMASSSMWTSGILLPGNQRQNSRLKSNNSNVQQYQHGIVGVRSRANHLQYFLGGGNHSRGMAAPTATKIIRHHQRFIFARDCKLSHLVIILHSTRVGGELEEDRPVY